MQRNEGRVHCDGDAGQMEIVKQHGQVIVQAPLWLEVKSQHPAGHGGQGPLATPQLDP